MARARAPITIALLLGAYVIAFALLQPHIGDAVFSLATVPIIVAAWQLGLRRGVIASILVVVLSLVLMQTIGGQSGFRNEEIPRIAVALLLGAAAGWVGDLNRRQRELLEENARIHDELRDSQQGLEHKVAERTAELVHINEKLTAEVSARREAEARAATADRMAVVGMLTAGIGHEINNPLAAIIANLDFIEESVELEDQTVTDALRDAHNAAIRAAEIVQHMHVFIQSSKTSDAADVRQVITSTVRMVANEIRHRARLDLDLDDTPPVDLSTAHLGQVLLNLLVNASQALPRGSAQQNTIQIRAFVADEHVRIEVSDTGNGIPPDIVPRIFEPFFTTKPVGIGTGLGLWVCHQIVTAARGTIAVDSVVGKGTTFRIELPKASPDIAVHGFNENTPPVRRVRLLIIDDDEMVGRSIARRIGVRHDVVCVDDAQRALAALAAGERFDVILCDLMMPVMNGVEFFHQLQTLAPEYADRVIFMTGGAFTAEVSDFIDDPKRRRLDKPFDVKTLELAITQVAVN